MQVGIMYLIIAECLIKRNTVIISVNDGKCVPRGTVNYWRLLHVPPKKNKAIAIYAVQM